MRRGRLILFLLCLLCGAGAWFLWHHGGQTSARRKPIAPTAVATRPASTAPRILTGKTNPQLAKPGAVPAGTNRFTWRLSNTTRPLEQLLRDDHAILLENALIDTRNPLNLAIPQNLQSAGDPGAYIVQARGPIDSAFRAMLAQAGVAIVAYIPNDAYLVRASANVAGTLQINPLIQAVIPYEPYYKVQSSLLAYDQSSLPEGAALNLGLFNNNAEATIQQIEKLGGQVFATDQSPFGPIVRVIPPRNHWTALAQLTGVQIVEPYHPRSAANDLARVTLGVSADTITPTNYLNLRGSNVIVEVNDTGIDQNHPDFGLTTNGGPTRVIGDAPQSLVDTNGHGTHVAGIIAGNGAKSSTVTNAPPGSVTNANYRGKAPAAMLYSVGGIEGGADTNVISDRYFQEAAALTNALISNNSWGYAGDSVYDLAAASYDAATRDALPERTGSQPVLFVFAAGNNGNGSDTGGGGTADTISSPATAKDVITVGALEQLRNINNVVTNYVGTNSQPVTPWSGETDSSNQVASFSSRGNVGIGYEGTFGRYKPDVVAPGTFVISTRSGQWDEAAYYNPTNYLRSGFADFVNPGSENFYSVLIPPNAVQLTIDVQTNAASQLPFPSLPINVWNGTDPRVASPYQTGAGSISIVPPALSPVGTTWQYGVSNNTSGTVIYDVFVEVVTTNNTQNSAQVLSNLNNSIGTGPPYYYRYETGTSMAAPAISGVLALMQDFFTNQWHLLPSPALLKAVLINGARATANYNFQVQNAINYEGWGLANLMNSLPPGITNQLGVLCSGYIQDQSPTNALATGDSQTYYVQITNVNARLQPLRITLAWTDPPGNPVAAVKLVNNLMLVVTNLANGRVYYGNDIAAGSIYNQQEFTNTPPAFDSINNIQNVYITALLSTNYSVTVMGYRVNVNAVTAQTNNVVQDYALVISSGNGAVSNAITVSTTSPIVSNPTGDQQITFVSGVSNSAPLLNQFVGANSPLLGTNTILFPTNAPEGFGPTNWQVTIGQTNQWHFYVVTNATTNPSDFTNAAFVTFTPDTLSIPRMGVFADSQANATRPEADIDLYVSTDPGLTNLDPNVISNCVVGTQIGASSGGVFAGASLSRGGTEFVVDTNSTVGQIYYIGVKSEDQMASEYEFLPIFSAQPFSQNPTGTEIVYGQGLPVSIPDGSPALPGVGYAIGIALQPKDVEQVTVSDQIWHQNFGDLLGLLNHNSTAIALNNHDSLGNTIGDLPLVYDDTPYSTASPSDGPGSLLDFIGQPALGVWMLSEVDNATTQTGSIQSVTLTIQPNPDFILGVSNAVSANSFQEVGYIDVPPGATNLTIYATNVSATVASPPLELFVKFGSFPTSTNFDEMALLNLGTPPGNSISIGPPLASGRYFIGVTNPSSIAQSFFIIATISTPGAPAEVIYNSSGPVPILDDAVTTNSIVVPDNATIYSMEVALRVDHPRISDLVFHLISPDGTRDLLVENRGGNTANMGSTIIVNNLVAQTFSGGYQTSTNVINPGTTNGTLQISYQFYTIPDEMAIFYTNGVTNFDSGMISGSGVFNIPFTNSPIFIVMNPNGNTNGSGDAWTYTVNAIQTNYYTYLVLTENTNTTTPIKFAVPPFAPDTNSIALWQNGFEESTMQFTPTAGQYFSGGWLVDFGSVDDINAPANGLQAYSGDYFIDLDGSAAGGISTNIATVPGQTYTLSFAYTRNPGSITGVFGQPPLIPQAEILINSNHLATVAANLTNSLTNLDWQTISFVFTATSPLTHLAIHSLDPVDYLSGVYLDAFTISKTPSDLYYLPEQSLADAFDGENAAGIWTLEVQDNRAGDNLNASLVNWQLRFNYTTTITNTSPTPSGSTITNILQPGSWAFYPVNVPANADMATNQLIFATGPLNMWFNQNNDPVGTNPPDTSLLSGVPSGTNVFTLNGTPPLLPGQTYYIGLYNPGTSPVTNGFEVDFHLIAPPAPLTNNVPVTNDVPAGSFVYYSVAVPTNADYATNLLLFASLPVNVWFNQNNNPVGTNPPDALLITNTTTGVSILGTNTVPLLLPGSTYYLGVQNPNATSVNFGLEVNFHLIPILTNNVPVTNTVPTNSFVYYEIQVPTNADYATNLLLSASLPVNVWFNQTGLPTGVNPPDSLLIGNATSGTFVLSAGSTPPLVPGATYYLGVQNNNGLPVTFGLAVNFHLVIPSVISGPTITATNNGVTNGFLLQWSGPTNYQYTIQWKTNLAPTIPWNTVVNPLINVTYTSTNGHYSWFDDGSLTGGWPPEKFYQVVANPLSGLITNSVPVTNNIVAGSMTPLVVAVPTNAISASNILISATGPINVYFNQAGPITSSTNAGNVLMLSNVTGGSFLLTSTTTPPLVPGANYYLGLQNPGASNVTFTFQVNFAYASPSNAPASISSITVTNINGTNAILLKWVAPTNYQFQVQWATNLPPTVPWNTISNVVLTWSGVLSPTNAAFGIFQFLDDGSLTGGFGPVKFYLLIEYPYSTPIPQTLTIINTAIIGSAVQFQWVAPTNYQYQVLWTTNLGLPLANWFILANPALGLSNGVYTFTDTNQTGPATSPKFFRLIEQ